MKLINISRQSAENFSFIVDSRDWMISIHSCGRNQANIVAPFGKIFHFEFDDINHFEPPNHFPINQNQADEIAKIIKDAEKSGVVRLWVHCDAGICRSGAVVEAAKLLGHEPDDEISNERLPNTTVFNAVRKSLGIKHSWEN